MNFEAGTLRCNIDGDTMTLGFMSSQTPDYFEVHAGNSERGLIKILWDKIKSPSEIIVQTVELKVYSNESNTIFVTWADFLTLTPFVI